MFDISSPTWTKQNFVSCNSKEAYEPTHTKLINKTFFLHFLQCIDPLMFVIRYRGTFKNYVSFSSCSLGNFLDTFWLLAHKVHEPKFANKDQVFKLMLRSFVQFPDLEAKQLVKNTTRPEKIMNFTTILTFSTLQTPWNFQNYNKTV